MIGGLMRRQVRYSGHLTLLIVPMLLTLMPSECMGGPVEVVCPPLALIAENAQTRVTVPVTDKTVHLEGFELSTIGANACLVTYFDRTPPSQDVYARTNGGGWILASKARAPTPAGLHLVAEAASERWKPVTEREIAAEIARLLLDPTNKTTVLIESAESIPTDWQGSDIYRDLKADGLDDLEIRRLLLSGLRLVPEPPKVMSTGESRYLRFLVWEFYGGFVTEVRVPLAVAPEESEDRGAEIRVLARSIGSWDSLQ